MVESTEQAVVDLGNLLDRPIPVGQLRFDGVDEPKETEPPYRLTYRFTLFGGVNGSVT